MLHKDLVRGGHKAHFAPMTKVPARSSRSRDDMPEHTGWIDDVANHTPGCICDGTHFECFS